MKVFLKQNWPFILLILYFIFPIDIIPDFLAPIIGPVAYTDDVVVAILLLIKQILSNKNAKEGRIVPTEVVDDKKKLPKQTSFV
jgi:uncharacterized membrane protein YkvA (DUF1232 family)